MVAKCIKSEKSQQQDGYGVTSRSKDFGRVKKRKKEKKGTFSKCPYSSPEGGSNAPKKISSAMFAPLNETLVLFPT